MAGGGCSAAIRAPIAPYGAAPYGGMNYGVDAYGRPLSDKSKLVAGLLQIFLGGLGIGRFYLGYSTIGVLQIVATVLRLRGRRVVVLDRRES